MNLTTSLGSYQPALSQLRQGNADPIYLADFLLQDSSTNTIKPRGLGMQHKTWHQLTFQKILKKNDMCLQNPRCREYPFI
jgi:hypothetical protein